MGIRQTRLVHCEHSAYHTSWREMSLLRDNATNFEHPVKEPLPFQPLQQNASNIVGQFLIKFVKSKQLKVIESEIVGKT